MPSVRGRRHPTERLHLTSCATSWPITPSEAAGPRATSRPSVDRQQAASPRAGRDTARGPSAPTVYAQVFRDRRNVVATLSVATNGFGTHRRGRRVDPDGLVSVYGMWMKVGPDTIVGANRDVSYSSKPFVGLHATPGLGANALNPSLTALYPYDCTRPGGPFSGSRPSGSSFSPE